MKQINSSLQRLSRKPLRRGYLQANYCFQPIRHAQDMLVLLRSCIAFQLSLIQPRKDWRGPFYIANQTWHELKYYSTYLKNNRVSFIIIQAIIDQAKTSFNNNTMFPVNV